MAASERHGVVTGRLWFDLPADFRYFRTGLHCELRGPLVCPMAASRCHGCQEGSWLPVSVMAW